MEPVKKVLPAWQVDGEGRAVGVQVLAPKRTYVFPWAHLLVAEGDGGKITIRFTTHDVTVEGKGLNDLLREIAIQRATVIRLTPRTERFMADVEQRPEAQISRIEVKEAGADPQDREAENDGGIDDERTANGEHG